MKKFISCIAAGMTVLTLLSGCASTANPDQHVTIAPKLNSKIIVSSVAFYRNSSGFTTCNMTLQNTTDKPVAVEWKTQWVNLQGLECDNIGSAWRKSSVQPGETKGFQNTALSTDAADAKIYVRPLEQ